MSFMFRGTPVFIPEQAEVSPNWRSTGDRRLYGNKNLQAQVQMHLDRLSGAELPTDQILHAQIVLDQLTIPCQVIPVEENARIVWGVHTKHTARRPGISPFVGANRALKFTDDSVSMEYFIDESGQLVITRMYPGSEYQPPLPWMRSVDDAPGGRDTCCTYWQRHAFVLHPGSFRNPEVPQVTPPNWWKPMS